MLNKENLNNNSSVFVIINPSFDIESDSFIGMNEDVFEFNVLVSTKFIFSAANHYNELPESFSLPTNYPDLNADFPIKLDESIFDVNSVSISIFASHNEAHINKCERLYNFEHDMNDIINNENNQYLDIANKFFKLFPKNKFNDLFLHLVNSHPELLI